MLIGAHRIDQGARAFLQGGQAGGVVVLVLGLAGLLVATFLLDSEEAL